MGRAIIWASVFDFFVQLIDNYNSFWKQNVVSEAYYFTRGLNIGVGHTVDKS